MSKFENSSALTGVARPAPVLLAERMEDRTAEKNTVDLVSDDPMRVRHHLDSSAQKGARVLNIMWQQDQTDLNGTMHKRGSHCVRDLPAV